MKGTIKQVIDAWVSGEHDKGRNSTGSIFFEGNVIYSYRHDFSIGRLVWDKEGYQPMLAIVTSKRYSHTTTVQQNMVLRAALANLPHGAIEICKFPTEVTLPVPSEYIEQAHYRS